ncbi:MAG: hypothetical protein CMA87_04890 [Euryarchaeota archaeon]|nr:hypothetical protein [Euryarchaeota archaeon]|tara:strand:- start:212 stop:538 length:327 start_codon:yes stop_codon:yes gene_type:complete
MNRLETIIEKEKEVFYSQRDKEKLCSQVLLLVQHEQESRKFKRNLCLGLFSGVGIMGFLLPQIGIIVNELTSPLVDVMSDEFLPVITFSYGLSIVLLMWLNKREIIFD